MSEPESSRDLTSRAEIHNLVVSFYREITMDELLGPVFEEVAEVDWSEHIPLLIDFWCRVLLGDPSYKGTILSSHKRVHEMCAFTGELFDRWYRLFVGSVDEHWSGPIADQAKDHAAKVGASLARQLAQIAWHPSVDRVVSLD